MPYVEGFGTWPFGEEWLWEAISGSYLPLLDLLDEGAPLTLSLTPVLCDQLEAPGIGERFRRFVEEVRRDSHERDAAGLRAGGHEELARELERSYGDYERALARFDTRGGDVLGAFAAHAQGTSSATHAVLPLLASDAGVRLQVQTGIALAPRALRRRLAGRLLAARVRVRAAARRCAHRRGRARRVRRADRRRRSGAREHLRPLPATRGSCSCRSTAPRSRACGATTATRRTAATATTTTTPFITTTRGTTTAAPTTTLRAGARA